MAITYSNRDSWYLFLIFPFLTAIIALKNYKAPWAKNIVWAFIVFYGFTFGMSKETSTGESTADITRYAQQIKDLYNQDLSFGEIINLYQQNDDIDIARLTIAIGVSRITDNQQVLTAIYAFIFGFFFTRNFWFLLDRLRGKIKPLTILLMACFFLVNPFWNINGFRFHTAVQIFIYGLLPFIFEGKKKSILFCALAILVHFSFLVPMAVLSIYLLLGNRTLFFFCFFLASMVSSEINIAGLNTFIQENAPEDLDERTASYRGEERVQDYREGTGFADTENESLHAKIYLQCLQWPLMALLVFLFFIYRKIGRVNRAFSNSLAFTLLFWGFANFMSSLPSGGRFLAVASLSALPLLIFYVQNVANEKFIRNKILILSPALLFFIIISTRMGLYSISVNTLISNPVVALLLNYNIAVNDLIK
ncbi:EpsG family protein [Ferruginibacter paludis]|uniref:EpsG family protein n=1 Tax=Ferruginibacter paludis TaxID=1310417 RepID=UPI0025B5F2C6|nr:EpsG family protein [Ferruginibacter paludis]MDN3658899.1 EpsG family protein [Ferruginibacter paludis]